MPRILIVATEFPPGPGGIGTHAYELSRHLADRGWKVSVLASQDYVGEAEASAFTAGLPFSFHRWRRPRLGPLGPLSRYWVLRSRLRSDRPDVVVASGGRAVLLSAIACRGTRTPWVAIAHGTEFGKRTGWMASALRRSIGGAVAVVCVSEYTRMLMRECGVRPKEETVIPNGADPVRFRIVPAATIRETRRELGVPDGRLLITVGHVTKRKGQDVVVRALPRILEAAPDVHYLVAGLPTLGPELMRLAAELGVAKRVHLLGRVDDTRLPAVLNAADLFVLTSRRTETGDVEGFGIAVVEAALCGKPAVVAADSGLAEAVRDGVTGVCVPPDDPAATASAIGELLESDARRRGMGESARTRALTEQTWASRCEEYDLLLRRIAGSAERAPASAQAAV